MIKLDIQLFGGRGARSGLKGTGVAIGINGTIEIKNKNTSRVATKSDINNLLASAEDNEPKITSDLLKIVGETHGTIDYDVGNGKTSLDFRKKSFDSLERKVNSDLLNDTNKTKEEIMNSMYDIVRYTDLVDGEYLVDDYEQIKKNLEAEGYKIRRVKNQFTNENSDYKGLNLVVENENGYKFELQYHTPESMKVKEINHKLYEEARLDNTSKERKKELESLMRKNNLEIKPIKNINKIKSMDDLRKVHSVTIEKENNDTKSNNNSNNKPTDSVANNKNINNITNSKDNSSQSVANKQNNKYYEIDERLAKNAYNNVSFGDYKENSETISYKKRVDEVYNIANELINSIKPDDPDKDYKTEKILLRADKFSKDLAEWKNKDNAISVKYPSQMITGAGGWSQSKIEARDKAVSKIMDEYDKKRLSTKDVMLDLKYITVQKPKVEKQGVAVNQDKFKNKHFEVIQNVDENRLQLKFDGKPDNETRDLLKHKGFKWSPKNQVWQRQLTANARYDTELIIRTLDNKDSTEN